MSFDKPYPNRKDKRKPYYGAKAIDHTCRNHGSCSWCRSNRTYRFRISEPIVEDDVKKKYRIRHEF